MPVLRQPKKKGAKKKAGAEGFAPYDYSSGVSLVDKSNVAQFAHTEYFSSQEPP